MVLNDRQSIIRVASDYDGLLFGSWIALFFQTEILAAKFSEKLFNFEWRRLEIGQDFLHEVNNVPDPFNGVFTGGLINISSKQRLNCPTGDILTWTLSVESESLLFYFYFDGLMYH